jgi:circadian clock protein KaiC
VTGTAGTGKTSLASHFADAACRRGERCLYFAFEESERQVVRDIRSIGIDLDPWIRNGLMRFHAASPNLYGLEMHLATMHRAINEFRPHVVVLDPISSLVSAGTAQDARSMLLRLLDLLKSREITVLLTSLTSAEAASLEGTEIGISSITDTWILLRDIERIGERNRGLYILKSRGTAHSNQIREFLLTEHGIRLQSVYLGSEGMLTGSERRSQEAQDRANALLRREGIEEKRREIERKKHMLQIQIEGLEAQFQADEAELARSIAQDEAREQRFETDRDDLARRRRGDASANPAGEDPEGNRR